jgi:thiamine pyrophosphokinase
VRALIVAGARVETPPSPCVFAGYDLVIAADSGADLLLSQGVKPDLLVGDMDSISCAARARLDADGVETFVLPSAKDETDLEVALKMAVERGATSIDILGALGGPRLDHLLGAVVLLGAPWLENAHVRLRDHAQEAWLSSGVAEIRGVPGDMVSLLPLSPEVEAVRTEGLLYPLRGERLAQAASRGLSNELVGEHARITNGAGLLLVIHYHSAGHPGPGGRDSCDPREGTV